ncbi:DUF4352 domain-containing protein [Streptomyces geranii]|uniref:DUF4352 domain-containing protein n=1 Tax=Streptomyces geranii TaxID=2058923 RepID=UPI000D047B94|nr:DUF4352 domain-containing protein [Streptomyces geranii]
MNQQQPHQHPEYSQYPQQQPQPPKKSGVGKLAGIGCAGVLGFFVLVGAVSAVVGDDSGGDSSNGGRTSSSRENVALPDTLDSRDDLGDSKPESRAQAPVTVSAKNVAFSKSVLADGSDHTSVLVTVTNNGDQDVDVNPLFFTITDTNGTKHAAELAADENQIDTVKLAPGENISGSVTGKGAFTPKYVTFSDGFLGDSIRAGVAS